MENLSEEVEIVNVDDNVYQLFQEWDMSMDGIQVLAECRISTENLLKMLSSQDIDQIFHKRELLAEKIKFRYNLNKWREQNDCELVSCCASDRTLSMVSSCLSSGTLLPATSKPDKITATSSFEFDLENILKGTVSGEELLERGRRNVMLSSSDQTSISRIKSDHFALRNMKMCPKTMENAAKQISKYFPTEDERINESRPIDLTKLPYYSKLSTQMIVGHQLDCLNFRGNSFKINEFVKSGRVLKILFIFFESEEDFYLVCPEVSTLFSEKFQSYKIINESNDYFKIENVEKFSMSVKSIVLNNMEHVIRF